MKKTLSAFVALMVFTVLFIGARTIIMQVEMKDGTVRYVDTEAISEFNFIKLDEIAVPLDTLYITESGLKEGLCYHNGYFTGRSHNVEIDVTYVPNDPKDFIFTIKNWADGCKPIKLIEKDKVVSLPCQSTGFTDPVYGEIWVADCEQYTTEVLGRDYTGFDYVTYTTKNIIDIETLKLKVVYYAPNYGDGKTFAKKAEERIFSKDAERFSLDINDYRADSDSQPYMEFRIKNTSGLPTKVGITYAYVDVAENEMDSVGYYGSSIRNKFDAEVQSAQERIRDLKYDFVTDFSEGDIATFKVPYSGRAYVAYYYSTFDIGGEPEVTLEDDGIKYYGFVYAGSNVKVPESKYGTYYYSVLFSGTDRAWLTRISPSDLTKNVKFDLSVEDLATFQITVPDLDARTADGYIPLTVDSAYVYNHPTYGRVMAADLYWYYTNHLPSVGYTPSEEQLASISPSVMDPESESLRLNMIYYVPNHGSGTSYFGHDYEYFIPDNSYTSLAASFNAEFSETEEPNKGIITLSKTQNGADIAIYKVVTVTENVSETAAAIKANPTNYTSYHATGNETIMPIDFDYNTEYYAIVEAYTIDGKYRGEQIISYKVTKPFSYEGYEYLGKGTIIDGWVLPGFTINGNLVDPNKYPWEIDIYRNKSDNCEYLLAHPWADCPFSSYNEYPQEAKKANIKIRIEGENVAIEPQSSGFGVSNWGGPLIIGNYEGWLLSQNPGASLSDVITYLKTTDKRENISYFDESYIIIPQPVIGAPGIGNGSFGYTWNNASPSCIFFPEELAQRIKSKRADRTIPEGLTPTTDVVRVIENQPESDTFDSRLNRIYIEKITLSE